MKIKVWTLAIDDTLGLETHVLGSEAEATKKLAEYCREHWERVVDVNEDPDETADDEVIELYTDHTWDNDFEANIYEHEVEIDIPSDPVREAAPDMLIALKYARDELGRQKPTSSGVDAFKQVDAAITKAEPR